VLEAVNHAARALGSSLDQHEAFAAFRRELRSMIAFDRLQIELAGDADSVFATAGGFIGGEGGEEVIAPLTLGDRALGTLTVARDGGLAFTAEEVEMVTLLASQVACAVENIRAYEAERSAAEELRRLSALRADFVSMVSHELLETPYPTHRKLSASAGWMAVITRAPADGRRCPKCTETAPPDPLPAAPDCPGPSGGVRTISASRVPAPAAWTVRP
jgi:GAF domain